MPDSPTLTTEFQSFLAALAALFAIVNPFSTMPLFLTLTANLSDERRTAYAARVSRHSAVIMLVTLFLGGLILEFFGISLPALRIAGGMIVGFLGFNLIFPTSKGIVPAAEVPGTETDYSFMPLAFPGLTGAGTIAVLMSISTKIAAKPSLTEKVTGHVVVVAAILALTLIIYVLFRVSTRLVGVLGAHGLEAMSRIMGLVLICIGVGLVGDGIKSFAQGA